MNVRKKQREIISRVLSLQGSGVEDRKSAQEPQAVWKVLIYDKYTQRILDGVLNVSELRKLGVTLHMLITHKRERVPDVPAIYFVRPTRANIDLIAQDLGAGLYDSFHLHFSSSVARPLLERLAELTLQTNSSGKIAKVCDQYSEFACLENSLVSLQHAASFAKIHSPESDQKLMDYMSEIVDGLFSLIVTMGVIPIIRARPGEAAQEVATRLNQRLQDHLSSRNNLFTSSTGSLQASYHRPVLILVDRTLDLATPLMHTWTYQALLNDVCDMHGSQVAIPSETPSSGLGAALGGGGSNRPKITSYVVAKNDQFWKEHSGSEFPKVGGAVTTALDVWKQEADEVKRKSGQDLFDTTTTASSGSSSSTGADDLFNAVASLPELQARKKSLDMHTNLAIALLKRIQSREIDSLVEVEQNVVGRCSVRKEELVKLLSPQAKPNPRDKIRLLLIYSLCHPGLGEAELSELTAMVEASYKAAIESQQQNQSPSSLSPSSASASPAPSSSSSSSSSSSTASFSLDDLNALKYLKQHHLANRIAADVVGRSVVRAAPSSGLSAFANMVLGQGAQLIGQVRTLVTKDADLPLTKIVDALMNNRETQEVENYLYLDPKAPKQRRMHSGPNPQPFKEAFVFVLGGGCYSEYQNLRDFAKKSSTPQATKTIGYGCTDLLAPEQFLTSLAVLGSDRPSSGLHLDVD